MELDFHFQKSSTSSNIVITRNIYETEVKTKFQSALSLVICEAFECFILTQKCSSVMLHANIANPVLAVDSDW